MRRRPPGATRTDRRCPYTTLFRSGRGAWRGTQQAGDAAVLGRDHFGAEFEHAALLVITRDDLHALTSLPQAPVFLLGVREVLFQGVDDRKSTRLNSSH